MKRIIFIIVGLVAVFFAGVYLLYQPQEDVFPETTVINGIDVSGMKIEDAEKKLSDSRADRDFSFVYKGKSYSVPMDSLKFDMSEADSIMPGLSHLEKFRYFLHLENDFEIRMPPEDTGEFLRQVSELAFCDNEGKEKSKDAYVDLSDFEFRVVKEEVGTEVDPEAVRDIALSHIGKGVFEAELTDNDIIKQPEIRLGTEEFDNRLQYCEDNLGFRLEYEVNGQNEVIIPQVLDEMVRYRKKGPKFNDERIKEYVKDLAGRCNEYNKEYDFTTHSGKTITVSGVTFGKFLDQESMVSELKDALKSQTSQKLELRWAQSKYSNGEGIGDSYIETSISGQHVWCYVNGKCVVDCDCVTGAPGHDTARGVFIVQYVTGPTTLRGNNDDGSTYESPVNCFVPFYGGQGFHGSNGWRSQWGGDIYKTSGSHGCVNCPDAAAKKIADTVSAGFPVVIY